MSRRRHTDDGRQWLSAGEVTKQSLCALIVGCCGILGGVEVADMDLSALDFNFRTIPAVRMTEDPLHAARAVAANNLIGSVQRARTNPEIRTPVVQSVLIPVIDFGLTSNSQQVAMHSDGAPSSVLKKGRNRVFVAGSALINTPISNLDQRCIGGVDDCFFSTGERNISHVSYKSKGAFFHAKA